jgi:hypothetical protein
VVRVALLPQARNGKGQERQGGTSPFDRVQHLVHQRLVLEAVALLSRGLGDCAPQALPREGAKGCQLREDRHQGGMVVALHEEVVAQRKQYVDVGLRDQTPEKGGEALLRLRRVLGE